MTGLAFEDDGYVCIAFIMRGATRAAAKQNGLPRQLSVRHSRSEGAGGLQCVGRDVWSGHIPVKVERSLSQAVVFELDMRRISQISRRLNGCAECECRCRRRCVDFRVFLASGTYRISVSSYVNYSDYSATFTDGRFSSCDALPLEAGHSRQALKRGLRARRTLWPKSSLQLN